MRLRFIPLGTNTLTCRCIFLNTSATLFPLPCRPGPLIYERDLYLAWTLKRSRAVCGQRRVVGVVGRGHLAGVMRAIADDRGGETLVRPAWKTCVLKSRVHVAAFLNSETVTGARLDMNGFRENWRRVAVT